MVAVVDVAVVLGRVASAERGFDEEGAFKLSCEITV
jgi:hypothetical protein